MPKDIIHSLWIGNRISLLGLLTIHSFLQKGHPFHLWTYYDIPNIPKGVILQNANEIIPKEKIFKYPENSKIDWGKGSFAGFSDIFRYKLLFEKGDWWVDMDVTCLKEFHCEKPYFFRDHWKLPVVGNILKAPKGSELMKNCYRRAQKEVDEDNLDWHKPIQILNEEIEKLNLLEYRLKSKFNPDISNDLKPYLWDDKNIPEEWWGIHWIQSSGKRYVKKGSTLWKLLEKYNLLNRLERTFGTFI